MIVEAKHEPIIATKLFYDVLDIPEGHAPNLGIYFNAKPRCLLLFNAIKSIKVQY